MIYDLWKDDLVFIIPTSEALKIPNIHFSPAHWAKKREKECGRHLFDSTDKAGGHPLNTESAKIQLKDKYGNICHPTIDDIVLMITTY
jgi:hypothetical protein